MSDLRPSEQKWVALLVLEAVKDLVKVDDREILRRLFNARVAVLPSPNRRDYTQDVPHVAGRM